VRHHQIGKNFCDVILVTFFDDAVVTTSLKMTS